MILSQLLFVSKLFGDSILTCKSGIPIQQHFISQGLGIRIVQSSGNHFLCVAERQVAATGKIRTSVWTIFISLLVG